MTSQCRWFGKIAPVGLYLALSCVLCTAARSQSATAFSARSDSPQEQVASIPSAADASVVANRLLQAFRDRSALNRAELLEQADASAAFDPPAAVSLLQESLLDEDQSVREAALRALTLRDNVETPVLTQADVAPFQGENADLAKVHFAEKNQDTAALRELMQNGDAVVQEHAVEALAAYDVAGVVDALRTELRDTSSLYRLQTLELLARSPYTQMRDELLPVIRELTEDQDPLMRHDAKRMLKRASLGARQAP